MIESLINQAVNYVANIEYGEIAVKVIYKTGKFIVVHGYELLCWINQ